MMPSGIAMKKSSCPGGVTYMSTIFFAVTGAFVASVMGETRGVERGGSRPGLRPTKPDPYVYQMEQGQGVREARGGRDPYRPVAHATEVDPRRGDRSERQVDRHGEPELPAVDVEGVHDAGEAQEEVAAGQEHVIAEGVLGALAVDRVDDEVHHGHREQRRRDHDAARDERDAAQRAPHL